VSNLFHCPAKQYCSANVILQKVLIPKTDIWQAFYKIWNSRNTVETKKGGFIKQFFERNDGYHFDGVQPSV